MQFSKNKKLNKAELLKNEGKYKEALQLLNNLEEKANLPPQEKLACQLLKSTCLNRLGQDEDALKLAKQVYQESKRMGNLLLSFDASIEIAEALLFLGKLDKSFEIIDRSESLLKLITQEPSKELMRRKASIAYLKGFFHSEKGELDLSLQFLKQSLKLQEGLGYKQDIARSLTQLGIIYLFKGEFERAHGYYERGLILEENGFNRNIPHLYIGIQITSSYNGELEAALECIKRGLAFAEELNDKYLIPMFLNNMGLTYYQQNDLIRAFDCIERSLIGFEKINNIGMIITVLDSLIELAIHMNSYEQAQRYFNRMKLYIDQEKSKLNDAIYRMDEILMLKISPKANDRVKAKKLFLQFVEEEIVWWDIRIHVLLHLCDILLIELRESNDLKVVDELQYYITQILDIVENQNIYWYLAEIYLFQSKMFLLILDLKKAQRSLTQAQHICEKCGFSRLGIRVSNEQEELAKQLSRWEDLKQSRITIDKRMDFARLDEQLLRMFQLRFFLKKQISTQ
ncbi:hypothetical protein AC481_04310 [miscellaneous Crenarchaeota group archaeon SMTZ-80]|nr:MAG: hypothetical protein AC481_04310 [miscellaneous Crenarchaeota group archaeon SMTZ-80]